MLSIWEALGYMLWHGYTTVFRQLRTGLVIVTCISTSLGYQCRASTRLGSQSFDICLNPDLPKLGFHLLRLRRKHIFISSEILKLSRIERSLLGAYNRTNSSETPLPLSAANIWTLWCLNSDVGTPIFEPEYIQTLEFKHWSSSIGADFWNMISCQSSPRFAKVSLFQVQICQWIGTIIRSPFFSHLKDVRYAHPIC